jgi:small subunit ribosomal protein S18
LKSSDRRKSKDTKRGGPGGGFRGGRGKRVSILTQDPTLIVDYKDVNLLRKFTSPEGKILPRRITKCTAKQQRQVTQAVKRARHLALLPYAEVDS